MPGLRVPPASLWRYAARRYSSLWAMKRLQRTLPYVAQSERGKKPNLTYTNLFGDMTESSDEESDSSDEEGAKDGGVYYDTMEGSFSFSESNSELDSDNSIDRTMRLEAKWMALTPAMDEAFSDGYPVDLDDSSQIEPEEYVDADLEEPTSEIKTIAISEDCSLIVIEENGSNGICFSEGTFELELIYGIASLNGYKLEPGHTPIKISLGLIDHRVYVKVLTKDVFEDITPCLDGLKLSNEDLHVAIRTELASHWKPFCVIKLTKWQSMELSWISSEVELNPFKTGPNWFKINYSQFELINDDWEDVINTKIISRICSQANPVLMVTGHKNTGKSSLLSYLTNSMISLEQFKDGVIYVDLDPGQTGFTAPGAISAIQINKWTPLINPTYTNCLLFKEQLIASSSVGTISVQLNPDLYFEAVQDLWESVIRFNCNQAVKRPIVVNTMGWIRGLGLHLLADVIRLIVDDEAGLKLTVVEIKPRIDNLPNPVLEKVDDEEDSEQSSDQNEGQVSDYLKTDFDLNPQSMSAVETWSRLGTGSRAIKKLDFDYIQMISNVRGTNQIRHRQSKLARKLTIFSALSTIKELHFMPLDCLNPVKIGLDKVAFHLISPTPVPGHLTEVAIRMSFVQLVTVNELEFVNSDKHSTGLRTVNKLRANRLVGTGLLMAIDNEEKVALIATSISDEELGLVNCIVKPYNVQIPDEILISQLATCQSVDYVDIDR